MEQVVHRQRAVGGVGDLLRCPREKFYGNLSLYKGLSSIWRPSKLYIANIATTGGLGDLQQGSRPVPVGELLEASLDHESER